MLLEVFLGYVMLDFALSEKITTRRLGVVVFAVSVGITLGASYFVSQLNLSRDVAVFQNESKLIHRSIGRSIEAHLDWLRSIGKYFDTEFDITRSKFERFAGDIATEAVGIQALEWIPRVAAAKRTKYENIARFSGVAGFSFTELNDQGNLVPASEREEYYPVYFAEPLSDNFKALGFDLASNPARKLALERSRDSGRITFTAPIKLVQENGSQFGMLAFRPVYRRDRPHDTIEERRANIVGFALAVFRISDIVRGSEYKAAKNIGFTITDVSEGSSKKVLYASFAVSPQGVINRSPEEKSTHAFELTISLFPREWSVEFVPISDNSLLTIDNVAVSSSIAGIIISILLALAVASLYGRKVYAEEIVKEQIAEISQRAKELDFQKRALDEHAIVSITDVAGNITYANDKFCDISGYSREYLLGQNHRIVNSGEHPQEMFTALWSTITNGETWYGEIKNKKKNGEFYWVNATIVPFLDDSGHPFQYVAIRTDITAEKHKENALREATEKAETANVAKSEFLASMSHEIRTPMAGVLGIADILLEGELGEEQRKSILQIKGAGQSLVVILNDILDLSKIQAGKLEIEIIDFDLHSLISDSLELLYPRASEKDIALGSKIGPDLPIGLNGDPTRIRQVLVNLLGNAVKFTEQGSVTLSADVVERHGDDVVIRFEIIDTGIGIAEGRRNGLFQEFSQLDASTARKYEGTGLGLAISKRLVDLMGGEIGVESVDGKGSTFWFTVAGRIVEIENKRSKDRLRDVEFRAVRPLRILLAEDNDLNQMIITAVLDKFGHTVTVVDDGRTAVEAVRDSDFDIVLMDVRMPEMDGPDATRIIRQQTGPKASIPIVAVTADAIVENRDGYFEAGMNACVTKPINQSELLRAINEVLNEEVHIPDISPR